MIGYIPRGTKKLKTVHKRALAGVLAAVIAASGTLPIFAADEPAETTAVTEAAQTDPEVQETKEENIYTYTIPGLGSVQSASVESLGGATNLYRYACVNDGAAQAVYAVTVDPSRGGVVRGMNLGSRIGERTSVTTLVGSEKEDETLLAAVNADFFSMATGVPLGVYIEDGRFISSSDGNMAIGFDKNGKAFFGKVDDVVTIEFGSKSHTVEYMNKYPTIYGVYLLTEDYAPTTRLATDVPATEYVIQLNAEINSGDRVRGKVTEVRRGDFENEIPEGCAVLIVPDAYEGKAAYDSLEKGDRVYIEVEVNKQFAKAVSAIGGGSVILADGKVAEDIADEDLETRRHPRTALGMTADGEVMLFVADGRQSSYATGLTMVELAEAMRALGCTDAINLDGGGSSIVVLFDGENTTVANSPSEKPERKVPNALAVYEDQTEVEDLHALLFDAPAELLLAGTTLALPLTLVDAEGDAVKHSFTKNNTTVTVDEAFGSATIADGEILFTAGDISGLGKVRIVTEYKKETITLDIFLTVTSSIDSLTLDQTVLMAPVRGEAVLHATAQKDGKTVYFGDELGVMCENADFEASVEDGTVRVSVKASALPAETEAPEEAETDESEESTEMEVPADEAGEEILPGKHGRVAVYLADQTVVLNAYFDDALTLDLTELLGDSLTASAEGYTITYSEDAGVIGGAYLLTGGTPAAAAETTAPAETTAAPAETTTAPVETTAAPAQTTTAPAETTAEPESITMPDDDEDAPVATTAEPAETTDEPAVTTAPEEVFAVLPEGAFAMEVRTDSIASSGLSGKRIWMWADGLSAESHPHAVFTVTDADGDVTEHVIYYDKFYDFLDYNGRALLTLAVDIEEDSVIAMRSPLAYTAFDPVQAVAFGPICIGEDYETNRYADMGEHWANYYVNALSYMGIVGGSLSTSGELVYIPNDGLSREQFAKILVNYLQIDVDTYSETALDFADVDTIAEWAVPYVRAAVGAGLMRGRSTEQNTIEFAPRDGITRQEAIYVLGGLLPAGEGAELTFTDSDAVASWAAENLQRALAAGLISGYDDGTVRPNGRITRAEAATVVVKLSEIPSKS